MSPVMTTLAGDGYGPGRGGYVQGEERVSMSRG